MKQFDVVITQTHIIRVEAEDHQRAYDFVHNEWDGFDDERVLYHKIVDEVTEEVNEINE